MYRFHVLQSIIYNICFRETKASKNPIEYIGYYQPHPLDDLMVLKLKLREFDDVVISKDYVSGLVVDYSNEIIKRLKLFVGEWLKLTEKDMKDIKEVIDFKETMM